MSEPRLVRVIVAVHCPACPYVSTARTVEAATAVCSDHHRIVHPELLGVPFDWPISQIEDYAAGSTR